jgi:ABC-type oligopeptide transport system ATPase subunit
VIELERVSKVYKVGTFGGSELPAVRQVSFTIEPGEVVSLIGESGSGKSTVGRMILRLLGVTGGSRVSSRTRSARTTRSSRSTACSG